VGNVDTCSELMYNFVNLYNILWDDHYAVRHLLHGSLC